jgi:hypothetical protein
MLALVKESKTIRGQSSVFADLFSELCSQLLLGEL